MDFSLIENHPWATAATVAVGALIVYLILRPKTSGGETPSGSYGAIYAAPDPTTTAANAQITQTQIAANAKTSELSAQLAALGLQGQTAVQLAQIKAGSDAYMIDAARDVTNTQTAAAVNVTNTRTAAELQLGLATTQQQTVDLSQQNASIIDRLLSFLSGGGSTTATAAPTTTTKVATPTTPGIIPSPVYQTEGYVSPILSQPGYTPSSFAPYGMSNLIPFPNFATCNPFDSNCVANNAAIDARYGSDLAQAQSNNNRAQCYANAENGRTPDEVAALKAQCNISYP